MVKYYVALLTLSILLAPTAIAAQLTVRRDATADTISIFRSGEDEPILTQHARPDYRPYIHPIIAPDGKGVLTQYQPSHHPHQTGLYWGFTRVNGRDYFHHPEGDYWRRVSATVLKPNSTTTDLNVRWQTVYDLLDENGEPVLRETQVWTMREVDGEYILDLQWSGAAQTDVTIGEYDYGGLFLSMPWKVGMDAKVFNSVRQADLKAEGQRAVWLDVGMQVEGRDDQAHIAIFDHPDNKGYPQPWRVDKGFGVGPVRARLGDWNIDKGNTAVIKHRLRVYTEAFNDKSVTAAWSAYTGRESSELYSQWKLAIQEGFEAEFLTPEKALAAMTLQEGFDVQVFASEPMITQPMAFCWDDRGRLWIAENRDYEGRGAGSTFSGESRISILEDTDRDGVADSKKVFLDRVLNPSAMAVGFDGLWLGAIPNLLFVPDRDGDDQADEDDIEIRLTGWGNRDMHEILNSLHWGPDGWLYGLQGVFTPSVVGRPAGKSAVYLPPNARDSKPAKRSDNPKDETSVPVAGKSLTTEFDNKESITWSFSEDGKVHVSQSKSGDPITGTYTQTGRIVLIKTEQFTLELTYDGETLALNLDGSASDSSRFEYAEEPTEINGGIWRYHPTKDRFEVVAHGLSNAWGIDYDAKGQIFVSACVIPHLWHIVPGGIYHRQAGSHFNPHVYSDIRTIGDHRHRSAHGGARIYLSDAFPPEYHGRLFMGNIHEHAVLTDILEPSGSGFVGRHGDDFMLANNAQFIGFSMEIGPDGAVYILDWHDADICGGTVRTKDTGRVFRIAPTKSNAKNWEGRYADLRTMPDSELVELQRSKSAWHARRARLILQNRSLKGALDKETPDALRTMFQEDAQTDIRLRAMWALHITNTFGAAELLNALQDSDEYVRAWAIQLLCEDMAPSDAVLDLFATMAEVDASPVVRLYLASALQRIDLEDRWPIARHLVTHDEDYDDHNIPKLLWYGIEPLVTGNPDRALELARRSRIPMVTQHIARRLTSADQLTELVDEIGRNAQSRELLLLGMRDGLEGRNDAKAPENWPKVYDTLREGDDESASIALQLSLQFGDAVAAKALVATLKNDANRLGDRQQAIRGLAARKRVELKPLLIALLEDDALRPDAIRAVASYDDVALGTALLERYPALTSADKLEVVHALSSRPAYGTLLMNAIESGDVPRRDIPAYIARLLFRVVGNRFLQVWGPVEDVSPDIEVAFAKFNALLTEEALAKGSARQGREIFNKTCIACHQMYGEGGNVGPDLTGANRTDINYLLGNILTPSAVINDDYKMTMVFTNDGQVYSGILANENRRQLQLRIANVDEPVTIAKSQITDREITDLSMMPEGTIDHLSDSEVVDLFVFLRSLEPVLMQDAAER